jgi:hypothetical protein
MEVVLADLPSKSTAFSNLKHESRQIDTRPATYIPCHDTSPPMHQIIRETSDESILYYVQKMKIDSKVIRLQFLFYRPIQKIDNSLYHLHKAKQVDRSIVAPQKRPLSSPTASRKRKKELA